MASVLGPEPWVSSESADDCEAAPPSSEPMLPTAKASALWRRRRGTEALSVKMPRTEEQTPPLALLSDRYKILEQLGSGCVGRVHRAVHLESGREMAIKIPRSREPGLADVSQKEYDLLKRLGPHPHIIEVVDFHNLQGEAALVLEFFEGSSLQAVVQEKRLLEETARTLFTALCKAVAHLHEHSILHRDIKPANVLVSRSLRDLRLIDFNVATCLEDGEPLTPTGTALYKAPELILGEPPCERSDVWASGQCLFFALSGHLPQGRDGQDPFARMKEEVALQPVSFRDACWDLVSGQSKSVIQRCLAVSREDRPSMDEILSDPWLWSGPPLLRSLSVLSRVVPGAEAWLSVLPYTCQMCIEALDREART